MHSFKRAIGSVKSVKLALIFKIILVLDLKQTLGDVNNEQIKSIRYYRPRDLRVSNPPKIPEIGIENEKEINNFGKLNRTHLNQHLVNENTTGRTNIFKIKNLPHDRPSDTGVSNSPKILEIGFDNEKEINKFKNLNRTNSIQHLVSENTTDNETILFQFSTDKLVVVGHLIRTSRVVQIIQKSNGTIPKTVAILSLNKIVVDVDVNYTGSLFQLIMIAPTWEIIGTKNIILNGAAGADVSPEKAPDGVGPGSNGESGQSGGPGEPGGHILAIGGQFINGEGLKLFAKGGRGGKGQDGGDGTTGSDGKYPDLEKYSDESEWENEGFIFTKDSYTKRHIEFGWLYLRFGHITKGTYRIYGTNGTIGGNGGDGGGGGKGGARGIISVIELKGQSISTNNIDCKEGADGVNGVGGASGLGGQNGGGVVTLFTLYHSSLSLYGESYWSFGGRAPEGSQGAIGQVNKYEKKILLAPKYAITINHYKSYLRENLKNNTNGKRLVNFYNEIDKNEKVISLYDTFSFIDELKGLEVQYYKIHDDVSIVPFYQSLSKRILKYASDPKSYEKWKEEKDQHKKVLCYLYAAIMSKMITIESGAESNLVIDIKKYLQLIAVHINNLKESTLEVAREEFVNHQETSIHEKIEEAINLINSEIKPELENIFLEINEEIKSLINEIITKQNSAVIKIIEEKEKENNGPIAKFLEKVGVKQILTCLKFVAIFFGTAMHIESGIKHVINDGVIISDAIMFDETTTFMNQIPKSISDGLSLMENIVERKYRNKLEQLDDVEKRFDSVPDLEKFKQNISDIRNIIMKENQNMKDAGETAYNDWKRNIIESLDKEREDMLQLEKKETDTAKTIEYIINILKIPCDFYIEFKKINKDIDLKSKGEEELNILQQFEKSIYIKIIPSFKVLKSFIETTEKHLENGTNFKYDMENWKMRHKIEEIKSIMISLRKNEKNFNEKIMHLIAKLQDGMTTMINIYNLINKYRDQAALYAFIGRINSRDITTIDIKDEELKKELVGLDQMIKTNIVLNHYQRATSTFKQYIFPFAKSYISDLRLHLGDVGESTHNLALNAMFKLEKLKDEIAESTATNTRYDKYIHTDVTYSRESPFYVWDYSTHKESISKLLQGKEVSLEADVTRRTTNAVKFNMIGIKLRARNVSVQSRLERALDDFSVTLIHSGNSYYRCGKKVYTISSDRQIMEYSFRRDADGEPAKSNLVYRKIRDNDYMLSPYTVWSIKIFGGGNLDVFKNETIDLELEGRGQYAERGGFDNEVCQQDLERYYRMDSAMTKKALYEAKKESNIIPKNDFKGELPPGK